MREEKMPIQIELEEDEITPALIKLRLQPNLPRTEKEEDQMHVPMKADEDGITPPHSRPPSTPYSEQEQEQMPISMDVEEDETTPAP